MTKIENNYKNQNPLHRIIFQKVKESLEPSDYVTHLLAKELNLDHLSTFKTTKTTDVANADRLIEYTDGHLLYLGKENYLLFTETGWEAVDIEIVHGIATQCMQLFGHSKGSQLQDKLVKMQVKKKKRIKQKEALVKSEDSEVKAKQKQISTEIEELNKKITLPYKTAYSPKWSLALSCTSWLRLKH